MPAFATIDQLGLHLQAELDELSAEQALDGASALLRSAAGLTVDPDPVPLDLRTWALELAAMIYENPSGLASEGEGDFTPTWDRGRRKEILDAAAKTYGAAPGPSFDFPAASSWPSW